MNEIETTMADLNDLKLNDILAIDPDSPLFDILTRVLQDADKPQDVVAGFQSAI